MQSREGNPDFDWDYLQSEHIEGAGELTPYDFLHGYCTVFAQYLHDIYGYRVECVYEEPCQLVHCYCIARTAAGLEVYIDVRGVCSEGYDTFMEDFLDCGLYTNDEYSYTIEYDAVPEKYCHDTWSAVYRAALAVHDNYCCYAPSDIKSEGVLY